MIQYTNNGGTAYAPRGYWLLSPAMKAVVVNGVGPKCCAEYIPNSIFGLDITEEAYIHDYCWFFKYDFKDSNLLFYMNVKRKIDEKGGFFELARHGVNATYYGLLSSVGHFFY